MARSTLSRAAVASLTALSLMWSTAAMAQTPEDFGFGTVGLRAVQGGPAFLNYGELPLLTILADFIDVQFPANQGPDYYRDLLFPSGPGQANIAGEGGFFEENSFGQFRFSNAGVLGPFRVADNPDT